MSSVIDTASRITGTNVAPQESIRTESDMPDNYVAYTLRNVKPLPDVGWDNFWTELNWPHVLALGLTPVIGIVGAYHTRLRWETTLFSIFYYFFTGFGT